MMNRETSSGAMPFWELPLSASLSICNTTPSSDLTEGQARTETMKRFGFHL